MTVASKVKQTLAALKGSRATIRLYEAQTNEKETRAVFHGAIETMDEIVNDLEKRIQTLELQEPQYKGN